MAPACSCAWVVKPTPRFGSFATLWTSVRPVDKISKGGNSALPRWRRVTGGLHLVHDDVAVEHLPPSGKDGDFDAPEEVPSYEEGFPPKEQLRSVVLSLREEDDTAPIVRAARVDLEGSGDSD